MKWLGTYGETVFDLGLEKVTWYAQWESTDAGIATALTEGIAFEIWYNPSEPPPPGHILKVYDVGEAVCNSNATLLRYLSRIAGIDASLLWLWGGQPARIDRYTCPTCTQPGSSPTPSFRTPAPTNDSADESGGSRIHPF